MHKQNMHAAKIYESSHFVISIKTDKLDKERSPSIVATKSH